MRKIIYVFLSLVLVISIFYFSVTSGADVKGFSINAGFLPHLIAYFLLSFLIFKSTNSFKLAVFLSGTYGFIIEIVQYFVPYRSFQVIDVVLNYFGSSLVLLLKFKTSFAESFC